MTRVVVCVSIMSGAGPPPNGACDSVILQSLGGQSGALGRPSGGRGKRPMLAEGRDGGLGKFGPRVSVGRQWRILVGKTTSYQFQLSVWVFWGKCASEEMASSQLHGNLDAQVIEVHAEAKSRYYGWCIGPSLVWRDCRFASRSFTSSHQRQPGTTQPGLCYLHFAGYSCPQRAISALR